MLAAIMPGGVGTLLMLALPAYELRANDWEFMVKCNNVSDGVGKKVVLLISSMVLFMVLFVA